MAMSMDRRGSGPTRSMDATIDWLAGALRFRQLSFRDKHNRTHPCPPAPRAGVARPQRASWPREQCGGGTREPRAAGSLRQQLSTIVSFSPGARSRSHRAAGRRGEQPEGGAQDRQLPVREVRDVSRRRRSLMSGWRRMTPVAEHGSIHENALKGPAVPETLSDGECRRRRASRAGRSASDFPQSARCAPHRCRRRDRQAGGACSRRCTVLPPGAAQASSTRMPGLEHPAAAPPAARRRPVRIPALPQIPAAPIRPRDDSSSSAAIDPCGLITGNSP